MDQSLPEGRILILKLASCDFLKYYHYLLKALVPIVDFSGFDYPPLAISFQQGCFSTCLITVLIYIATPKSNTDFCCP